MRTSKAVIVVGAFVACMQASSVWARRPFPFGPGGWRPHPHPVPGPRATPEIDPGALRGALTILAGGMLLLTDRRRGR
jgi:hypothetical protein